MGNSEIKLLASKIVSKILKDLEGRKGVGDELESIDEDVKEELVSTLEKIAFKELSDNL